MTKQAMTKITRALVAGAVLLGSRGAFALPNAPWDNPEDDKIELVKGVSAYDYLNGQRAPNGFVRDSLSQGYADYLLTVFEWTFDMRLTTGERDAFFKRLSGVWLNGKMSSGAPGAFKVLEDRRAVDEFSPDSFTDRWSRTRKRNEQLQNLRAAAREDPENGKFLLSLYDRHNPALAPGEPRLTRATTNALTARVVFMINEVIGKRATTATPELQRKIATQTAALWPKLSPGRRAELLKLEESWWYMQQEGWKWQTEETREEMRIQWGSELQSSFPAVKPMYVFRKTRLQTARRRAAARWAKMSPAEKQLALMQLQNQAQMNQMMISSMQNMQAQNHATNMNIIENMKPTPQFHYYVK